MGKNFKKILALILIFCLLGSNIAFAQSDNGVTDTIKLVGDNVVETVSFIDSDGIPVRIVRTTTPNDTYTLELIKNGITKISYGTVDYDIIYSYLPSVSPRYKEVYLGTASTVSYIGPEYQTASDLASAISEVVPNIKVAMAAQLASYILGIYAHPVSLWIKKVTDTYEVHGDAGGFLGYYHMYDAFYVYTHSNTTGADYIHVRYDDRQGTTPGV